jgi:glycosyltransferase involved in cell wall biosynthesis
MGLRWRFPQCTSLPFSQITRFRLGRLLEATDLKRIDFAPRFSPLHHRRGRQSSTRLDDIDCDLYHITNTQCDFSSFSMPIVITVHDLAWMRVPRGELPQPAIIGLNRLLELIRRAQHVICDSECTRQDVLELAGRNPECVSTVHLAPRSMFLPLDEKAEHQQIFQHVRKDRPYFLAVSTIEPRKNFVRLVQAFSTLAREFPDHQLIIVGAKRSAWPQTREAIARSPAKNRVHAVGHVPNEMVRDLLWGCEALVYPSLYEGFGLPAIEAMACGTPVICSAAGSLGEVVSDAAVIVDPLNIESIAYGMRIVAASVELQKQLRKQSLEQASKFSWDKTAKQTVAVYRSVIA